MRPCMRRQRTDKRVKETLEGSVDRVLLSASRLTRDPYKSTRESRRMYSNAKRVFSVLGDYSGKRERREEREGRNLYSEKKRRQCGSTSVPRLVSSRERDHRSIGRREKAALCARPRFYAKALSDGAASLSRGNLSDRESAEISRISSDSARKSRERNSIRTTASGMMITKTIVFLHPVVPDRFHAPRGF